MPSKAKSKDQKPASTPEPAQTSAEPLVVADAGLLMPENQAYWTDDSMFATDRSGMPVPRYSVQEVAKMFFGRSPDWLRLRMRPDDKIEIDRKTGERTVTQRRFPEGYFVLDGKPMEFKRTESQARYFTLADVERMAHALAQGGLIDGAALTNIVLLVKYSAKQYGYIA